MNKDGLSLLELNGLIRNSIETCLPDTYWISAELSDVRVNASGHCYMEFIQKDEKNGTLIAKARGMIWANLFNMLRPYFEETTGEQFRSGLKVSVEVEVKFHELYGYSLLVVNIDPTYTIGDLVQKRREIVKLLEQEGVINLNREIPFPILPQRVAVISSATAAGYGDFCDQLANNDYGFPFYIELFTAIMQGEQVEKTLLKALDTIFSRKEEFDVVVIIRGGGATSDLSGFDTYLLAASCAQFPLPIITGIGHERDDTILDLVANRRVKTPTAAAELLVAQVLATYSGLKELKMRLKVGVEGIIQYKRKELQGVQYQLPALVNLLITSHKYNIEQIKTRFISGMKQGLRDSKYEIQRLKLQVDSASPELVLKRGYAIIKQGDSFKTSVNAIDRDKEIEIHMKDGIIYSKAK